MGRGDGSAYQDRHGQWWAKFPASGDDTYRRKRCASRKEAESTLKAWRAARDAKVNVSASRQPVAQWLVTWLEGRKGVVTDGTHKFYARHAGYAAAYIGRTPMEDVSADTIDGMVEAMHREKVTPQTIRHTKTVLAMAFKRAVRAGVIMANPVATAERVKVARYRACELTRAEVDRLCATVEGRRLALAVHLAAELGLRRGEVLALRWADIDFAGAMLTIVDGKTPDAAREFPLLPGLLRRLREHFATQAEERLIAGPRWRDEGLVLPSEVGTAVRGENFHRWFKTMLKRAGLPDAVRFHDLRHYAISEWYASGGDPRSIQTLAGHADPALSQERYAHPRPDKLRAILEAAEQRRRA